MNPIAILLAATTLLAAAPATQPLTPESLHQTATAFYEWRQKNYPVWSSDQGLHTWDDRLTDYSPAAIAARKAHIEDVLARVRAADIKGWSRDDKIDWILFRSQIEGFEFTNRVLRREGTDPQTYVGEASNAIFSLLKKDYDTPRKRALAATARLRAMPAMLEQGKKNLTEPVRLYAQLASESARSIDPLFNESLAPLARDLSSDEQRQFESARDGAIRAMHAYADWLDAKIPSMKAWRPMGEANYNYMLRHLLLLPMDARDVAHLGEVELTRYRAMEALLPDPSLADPDPKRVANIPPDQQAFLAAYQSREEEMIRFLKDKRLITIPDYVGPFLIKQLPEAFKPTSPGGFMNTPGLYDKDNS
ncbi:MAG: DUF885 family protein, partial [Thermoanaerobaculia bacterium]